MTSRTVVQLVIVLVAIPLLPMIVSGVWAWWEACAYELSFVSKNLVNK